MSDQALSDYIPESLPNSRMCIIYQSRLRSLSKTLDCNEHCIRRNPRIVHYYYTHFFMVLLVRYAVKA